MKKIIVRYKLDEKDHRSKLIKVFNFDKKVADMLHKIDDKYSLLFGNILVNTYKEKEKVKEVDPVLLNAWVETNKRQLNSKLSKLLDWLKGRGSNPNPRESKDDLKKLTLDQAKKLSDAWHKYLTTFNYKVSENPLVAEEQQKALINYPDGSYWIDLDTNNSNEECKAMGHCGRTRADTLFSFRDKNGESHLTMSFYYKKKAYTQLKGKGNKKPESKYTNVIYDIFKKLDIDKYDPEYQNSGDFHVDDFPESQRNEILKKHPDLEDPMSSFTKFLRGKGKPGETLEDYKDMIDFEFQSIKVEGNDIYIQIDGDWFYEQDSQVVDNNVLTEDMDYIEMNMGYTTSKNDFLGTLFDDADPEVMKKLSTLFPDLEELEDIEDYYEMEDAYGVDALNSLYIVYVQVLDTVAENSYYRDIFKGYKDAVTEIGEIVGEYHEGVIKVDGLKYTEYLLENMEDDYTILEKEDIIGPGDLLSLGINFDHWYPNYTNKEFNEAFLERLEDEYINIEVEVKQHLIDLTEVDINHFGQQTFDFDV